jgi:cytochrome P450
VPAPSLPTNPFAVTTLRAPFTFAEYRPRFPGEAFLVVLRGRLPAYRRLAGLGSDVCFVRAGRYRVHLLTHPELVRELLTEKEEAFSKGKVLQRARYLFGDGLLTAEGALHRKHRKVVLHAFHYGRIQQYAETMVGETQRMVATWRPGSTIGVDREMMALTLAIVARTLFGADVHEHAEALSKTFRTNLRLLSRKSNPVLDALARASGVNSLQERQISRRLDRYVGALIQTRRSSDNGHDDLLQMLLESRDAQGEPAYSAREVRDEVVTMLVSGHETTAIGLTWLWYLLARHPEVEARLHAEVDAVLGDRPPGFADVERLPFTRQVVAETLRLYAPLWAFARQATAPVDIGGHQLAPGEFVLVSPLMLHHDPAYWRDPLRFDPDRFAPGADRERHRFAYMPFSAGPRGCIGEQFAWTEIALVVATIAQRWRLRLAGGGEIPPAAGLLTLRPARPVRMIAEARG